MVLINVYSVMKDVTARKNNQNRLIFKKREIIIFDILRWLKRKVREFPSVISS